MAAGAIVVLMFTLSWAIATAQEGMVATMKAHVRDVKRWGGWILIAIGAWLIVLVVFGEYFTKVYPV